MEAIRVLHVIKGLGRGGAERLLVSTIREHGKGYAFTVVYFLPWKNQLVEDLRAIGCRVECLPARGVAGMLMRLPGLYRLMRDGRFQLVHAHLPWSGIVARMAARLAGIPLVYTEHNLVSRYRLPTRWMNKLTFGWQAAVVAVSDKAAGELHHHYRSMVKVQVIPNGVDVGRLPKASEHRVQFRTKFGIPEDAVVIGTVAVFTRQKRIDRWIRISRRLSMHPDLYFIIVGDGLLRGELEQQAADLVASGKLRFTGLSAVPEEWMACMDVFLSTSDYEGLPVALLEAMGIGCVPVVTAVGGVPTVVRDAVNGFLYQPEEEEKAGDIILSLATDATRRQQLGFAARKTIESEFRIRRMVESLEKVYKYVMAG